MKAATKKTIERGDPVADVSGQVRVMTDQVDDALKSPHKTGPNWYETRARDLKCKIILARMLEDLARLLAIPENDAMIQGAAASANQHPFSEGDKARLIEMVDILIGKLRRGEQQ